MTTDRPTDSATIAVLDVGKTNIKLAASTEDGVIVDARNMANPTLPGPPWVHHDLPTISEWVFSALAELCRVHPIAHFVAVGHGVGGTLVGDDPDAGGDGMALPMIDYEQPLPDGLAEEYAPLAGGFFDRGSAIMLGSTHQARQLYWMQRDRPKEFAAARWALGLPQYWAWRLTGRAVSERSYLGAQSHLWNVRDNCWSPIVAQQNWQRLMPPMAWAWDAVGPIRPALARRHGLPETMIAHAGAHDSSANLYRYQCTGMEGFTLMSTGTWLVGMANDVPLDRLDEGRGMTCNCDIYGRPTGGALVMGGREFEHVAGNGVTVGAALLCRHNDRNGPAAPAPLDEAQPMKIDGLQQYQARWREAAAANARRKGDNGAV